MKNGAPIIAVKMEMGISAAVALRATVSMISRKLAPRLMLAGTTCRLLLPNSIRQICGISNPTQLARTWTHRKR